MPTFQIHFAGGTTMITDSATEEEALSFAAIHSPALKAEAIGEYLGGSTERFIDGILEVRFKDGNGQIVPALTEGQALAKAMADLGESGDPVLWAAINVSEVLRVQRSDIHATPTIN